MMNDDFAIPPSRELPPARLAQRREHLISEIAHPPSRWPYPRRGLLALVAVALIVVVGAASAIGGVRALILDRGFIGLPPEGATPSAPESGELVVQWVGRTATPARGRDVAPLVHAWVYTDGRMIWSADGLGFPRARTSSPPATSSSDSRPEGVELVRSAVAGLLDRSRALVGTVPADDDPSGPDGRVALVVFQVRRLRGQWTYPTATGSPSPPVG